MLCEVRNNHIIGLQLYDNNQYLKGEEYHVFFAFNVVPNWIMTKYLYRFNQQPINI